MNITAVGAAVSDADEPTFSGINQSLSLAITDPQLHSTVSQVLKNIGCPELEGSIGPDRCTGDIMQYS
jgi:hypothetical protein